MKQTLILVILLFMCITYTKAEEQSSDYSHVSVTLTGYECTIITNGVVKDENNNSWYLPDEVIIPSLKGPCTIQNSRSNKKSSVDVIAIAERPGEIKAKPRSINIIDNPTGGWLYVTNKTAAIPGISMTKQCQRALHANWPLKLYTSGGLQELITVYDKDGIQVYVVKANILEAINSPYNGDFLATLLFVLKDDQVRLQTIEDIKKNYTINEDFSCQKAIYSPEGTSYERGLSCAEVEGTLEGKIDALKFIVIQGAYLKTGVRGVVGGPVPGPIFRVHRYLYLGPLQCASIKSGYRYVDLRKEDCDNILVTDSNNPMLISQPFFAFNKSNSTQWRLFFGDLHPLATLTYSMLKMGTDQTPLLNQIIKNIDELIILNREKN